MHFAPPTQEQSLDQHSAVAALQVCGTLIPATDWTMAAREGRILPAIDSRAEFSSATSELASPPDEEARNDSTRSDASSNRMDVYDRMARGLCRNHHRHLLITGLRGVGKTTAAKELARRAAAGQFPQLRATRFIWFDCQFVSPDDSRSCLEGIFASVGGEPDVVLCLDGLASLLRRAQGATNGAFLRSMLQRPGVRVMGILSGWEYQDFVAGDPAFAEFFSRIEIDEPTEDVVRSIVHSGALHLSRRYGVQLNADMIERAIALTANFLLSECQPAKSLKLLRRVCEDLEFDRTQRGIERFEAIETDVVQAASELTGVPMETLTGVGEIRTQEYEAALEATIVGQPAAVRTTAAELRLIKAGLTESEKPATVLLFAGMTGVGKTELAKRLAELYSTSKRLNVYPMGNFTEPHSVSGIIGVPPGYVGHEHGGRLVNELNADPYAVFLLDEAEKAHPNVWKPFLNLFDEGWLMDQRGIKAYADRAIFVLTTNAGGDAISQMSATGSSSEEIEERVRQTLSRIRPERSAQPVFTPQFLARIKQIVVFQPLDQPAMTGICRRQLARMVQQWLRKRRKEIVVSADVVEWLGAEAHARNQHSGGQEGGRIVRKLISDHIEHRVQDAAAVPHCDYLRCRRVLVSRNTPPESELTEENNSSDSVKAFDARRPGPDLLVRFVE